MLCLLNINTRIWYSLFPHSSMLPSIGVTQQNVSPSRFHQCHQDSVRHTLAKQSMTLQSISLWQDHTHFSRKSCTSKSSMAFDCLIELWTWFTTPQSVSCHCRMWLSAVFFSWSIVFPLPSFPLWLLGYTNNLLFNLLLASWISPPA